MTLKESLEKTKGIVKVGCKSGSGFFFAGDISDEDALQVITDAAERELRANEQKKKSLERFLLNHTQLKDNIIRTNIDRELNRFDKAEERIALEPKLEKKYKARWRKTFESKTRSLYRAEKRISEWKPALDREVKEDGYTPIFFEHYILVEGHIQGYYWDKDEYYMDKQN